MLTQKKRSASKANSPPSSKNKPPSIRDGLASSFAGQGYLPKITGAGAAPVIPAISETYTVIGSVTAMLAASATKPTTSMAISSPPPSSSNDRPTVLEKSALSHKTTQPDVDKYTLLSNVFPRNVSRFERCILPPKVDSRIDEILQLVLSVSLLSMDTRPSSPSSPSASLSSSSSSPSSSSVLSSSSTLISSRQPVQVEWIQSISNRPLEKERILRLPVKMIDKFLARPNKDAEAIREIVLIGPVLSKEQYRRLLNSFVSEFGSMTLLDVDVLHGLIQLVQDAPPKYLTADDMIQILRIIRKRLEDPAQQSEENTIPLMSALCKVLDIMEFNKVKDLDRVEEHEPLIAVIEASMASEDPLLKYLACYAFEALLCVPDDEPVLHGVFRHAMGTIDGIVKISGVAQMDISGLVEGVPAVIKGGMGLFGHLKKALGYKPNAPWYAAVRRAQVLVRAGLFKDLNIFVVKSPSRRDPMFQWGVCQLLGEIAVDRLWEETPRGQSIDFLKAMFKIEARSNQYEDTRRWVVTILNHIVDLSATEPSSGIDSGAIKVQAPIVVEYLGKVARPLAYSYPLINRLPLPRSSSLLKEINDIPEIELHLGRLRMERLETYSKPAVYIQLMSKRNLQATNDNVESLDDRVDGFLKGKAEVLLVLGDSGAGKSIFNQRLENQLWKAYTAGDAIPIFVDLKSVRNLDEDMVTQMLLLNNFTEDQIRELKKSHRFVLICDGYDECRKWINLHTINHLNKRNQWQAKMVITCRRQYLVPDYRGYFEPEGAMLPGAAPTGSSRLYEEAVIVPFQAGQIRAYIDQYILAAHENEPSQDPLSDSTTWTADQYLTQLNKMAHLMDLIRNPFLLKLVLDTLPRIALASIARSHQITRAELYDEFVRMHFENEQRRLIGQNSRGKMDREIAKELLSMQGNNFILNGVLFSKRLSNRIFEELEGVNSVDYSHDSDEDSWKFDFFGPDTRSKLLRESSQLICRTSVEGGSAVGSAARGRKNNLTRTVNTYEFLHRSFLEYFFSCLVYDAFERASFYSLSQCLAPANSRASSPSLTLASHPFGRKELLSEPSILRFLVDRIQFDPEFKDLLVAIVQKSKTDSQAAQAAANAITVLVRAGVHFNNTDLRGIQIPGADLTGCHFDSVQMQGANLTKVNFSRTWLRQVDFGNAKMDNVFFGEKPHFQVPGVRCCASSPKGKLLALGVCEAVQAEDNGQTGGKIQVYNTGDGNHSYSLYCPEDGISCLDFSRTGLYLASGGFGGTVSMWDVKEKRCVFSVQEHSDIVNCISFSPDGSQIISASNDRSVRVWNVSQQKCILVLKHTHEVQSVAWSPDVQHILSCTIQGESIRISNASTGETVKDSVEGLDLFQCMAYSMDGKYILLGVGKDLHLLDAETGNRVRIMEGHTEKITRTTFSDDGKRMASISTDHTVRLWDVHTGSPICIWTSDSDLIQDVVFFGDQQLATFSNEGIIRLWESSAENHDDMAYSDGGLASQTHRGAVYKVLYSADGTTLTTVSDDKTVRQWDTKTGLSVKSFNLPDYFDRNFVNFGITSKGLEVAITQPDDVLELYNLQNTDSEPSVQNVGLSSCPLIASPCGRWIADGDSIGRIRVWGLSSSGPTKARFFDGHSKRIRGLAFSLDGQQLVSSSEDNDMRVWDRATTDCVDVWHKRAEAVAWSPCGKMIASTDDDDIQIRNKRQSDHIVDLTGHDNRIRSMAWSRCSQWLASSDDDEVIRVWRVVPSEGQKKLAGSCKAVIQDTIGTVTSLAWSPVQSTLEFATAGQDHSVCLWRLMVENKSRQAGKETVRICLVWAHVPERLVVSGAVITSAVGLEKMDRTMLRQRHAIDESSSIVFKDKSLKQIEKREGKLQDNGTEGLLRDGAKVDVDAESSDEEPSWVDLLNN
ncbi:wD repeat domain [Gryganskiella cystojenkinii]|nr:wD repeat domain [Gryganskiella cystojenkinii]